MKIQPMATDVFVPLITPVTADGNVCGRSVGHLLASLRLSATGYIPCLTSGEGWRLTDKQWEDMLAFTLEHAGDRRVVVGIERPSTEEVIACAKRARQLGAAGVMLTSPFGESVGQDAIFDHYRQVHDAADLDVYIYNESSLSGNETSVDTLLAIASLPRVVGIKDSSEAAPDIGLINALQRHGLKYFVGWEHHLGAGLPADGCVVSLANLEPALCRVAAALGGGVVKSELDKLTTAYSLLSPDWYAHVKAELYARGIIASPQPA
ncbi:dihydrodipicolinate synthase family protein [Burkholderia sp. Bp8998]|uniref:dihydrodipicolinate synthase family protein n=1 Tax=Burkholderia sp. Bp8998 TaxID=2184557 RepID=UPI0028932856|nr:dihydrodipicolinate synthase family protein [Burkholderia sp. Bp8998]